MTPDCHVAHRLLWRPAASSSCSIWISDALLAKALQRFVRIHQRHGSSVPGPLEARRRATRRKNTSLASSGYGGPPIEVGALFRPDPKIQWWSAPTASGLQVDAVESPSILPSWLTGRPPVRPQSDHPSDQLVQTEESPTEKTGDTKHAATHFDDLLLTCQSLQQTRDLIQRLNVNLQQTPGYSRKILKYLLSSGRYLSDMHEFFIDGRLHPPGSGCFEELLQWLCSKSHPEAYVKTFYRCVRECLRLGILSGREIQLLLTKLASININLQGTTVIIGDTEAVQDWYWMMADAVRTCPIFSLKDLDRKHLEHWCQRVAEGPFAFCALQTFHLLQADLPQSGAFKLNTTRALLKKWIDYSQRAREHHLEERTEFQQELSRDCEKVAEFLAALPPAITAKSICQTTEKLVRDVMKTTRKPIALDIWMTTLSSLSSLSAAAVLQHRAFRECLTEEASVTWFSSRQDTVVRLWTLTCLTTRSLNAQGSPELRDLTRLLLWRFERQTLSGQDLLAELVFTLQSLPLPSPSAVLQKIAKCCVGHFQFHGSVDKLQADLLSISKSRVSLFKDDAIYRNATINLNDYLQRVAEGVNEDPEAFLQVALALIMRDKLSIKIITRILKHNLALNLALSGSSRPAKVQSEQHHIAAPPIVDTTPPSITTPNPLTPATALHLLNSLARAFAISPAISPRQSFRKVYWIYLHLHRYTWGSAIGPEITRSLWHAGVTRYKETGTSPDKVSWILGKVREVEGQEVADRLLWFGAGSVEGWEDWMRMGGKAGMMDVEGWRRVVNKKLARPLEMGKVEQEVKNSEMGMGQDLRGREERRAADNDAHTDTRPS